MPDNRSANEYEVKRVCLFPDLCGLDRILKAQKYPAMENSENLYSLPVPDGKRTSCNIVILGSPGTGKSTLALDMAAKLRLGKFEEDLLPSQKIERETVTVLYYGLEQSRQSLIDRAEELGGDNAIWISGPDAGFTPDQMRDEFKNELKRKKKIFKRVLNRRSKTSIEDLKDELEDEKKKNKNNNLELESRILEKWIHEDKKPTENEQDSKLEGIIEEELNTISIKEFKDYLEKWNIVYFPILSPRPLEQVGADAPEDVLSTSIFWERYHEIHTLIGKLKNDGNNHGLHMVVIDSLNVFGNRPITRYLIEQLFSLFTEERIIGVCIAEDPAEEKKVVADEPVISPGIINLADVVLRLGWEDDEGYASRNIEVVKSRQTPNIYGKHHAKIRKDGIHIYPSLHSWYTYLRPENMREMDNDLEIGDRLKWIKNPLEVWAENLKRNMKVVKNIDKLYHAPDKVPSIRYLITGPKDTSKSVLALEYAVATKDEFLLVTFDESLLKIVEARESKKFGKFTIEGESILENQELVSDLSLPMSKGLLTQIKIPNENCYVTGYEIWLAPGYLFSEEFVYYLFMILSSNAGKKIKKIILRDIGELPMRHPVMAKHILSGKSNYLPVLLELFYALGMDCLFVCTTDKENKDAERISLGLSSLAHFHIEVEKYNQIANVSGQLINKSTTST